MIKLQIGYPSVNDELSLIMGSGRSLIDVEYVIDLNDIAILKEMASNVVITDSIASYVLGLVEATRQYPAIELGVSSRFHQKCESFYLNQWAKFCIIR